MSRLAPRAPLVGALALSVLALALSLAPSFAPGLVRAEEPPPYDWGVAYWMSYDNNLERCGQPIIQMIREGVTSERVVAAVQADFTDAKGMHRFVIRSTGQEETTVDSEDSASEERCLEYLEWFVKTFRCKHYVVTFLDHGGKLDEMCFDEHPGPGGKSWMSGRILGEKLRPFAKKLGSAWELLFLQQCGRGSLENLYGFRGTAKFVMFSPLSVGAPNTYYTALGKWLASHPDATGADVASRIAADDKDYAVYACLRTEKLAELPKRLDALVAPFVEAEGVQAPTLPPVIYDVGEPIVDARTYFEAVAAVNTNVGSKEVAAFFKWTRDELLTEVRFRHPRERLAKELCGVSLYAPATANEAGRYAELDLMKESKLPALWKRLATRPPIRLLNPLRPR